MLKQTALNLLKSKMNRRTCVFAVNALHSNFYPRLHWYEKCTLIYKIHKYKTKLHEWNTERTAAYCELNYQYVLESLRLYNGVQEWPNLRFVSNRRIAVKILCGEFPAQEIDGHLIDKGITTISEGVTE